MANKGIGGDWAGYLGAAVTAGGDEKTGKALAMIQGIKEKNQTMKEGSETSNSLFVAEKTCKDAEAAVESSRRRLGEVAGRSGVLIEDQRERSSLRQKLQIKVKPLQDYF